MKKFFLCVCVAAAISGQSARAQTVPAGGVIRGVVTIEPSGAAAHGVTVLVIGVRRQATTGDDGRYEIANVPAGVHEVLAQREHLGSARQTVTVTAGQTVTLDFRLSAAQVHEEVTVTAAAGGATTTFESFSAIKSLDSTELAKNRGATVTDALVGQPGVAVRSFGAGSARPIIRGFDGDRVLIMQDGVRTGDLSSQSGDHGLSLDPAGLERVEVVRGPLTLLYGSNAVGGVVNTITPQEAFRQAPFSGILGGVSMDAGTANGQGGIYGTLQYGKGAWQVWAGGGSRRTGDYTTPLGPIENSGTQLGSGRAGLGWSSARGFLSIGGQVEQSRFGIPFAGEFHHHHDEGLDPDHEEELEVDIKSARRDVRLDAGLRGLSGVFESIRFVAGATRYSHDEIEIEDAVEAVGTTFRNDTTNARLELEQAARGRLIGRIGVEWLGRQYRATGEEALAPDTRQTAVSFFAYEELALGRWRAQFGGRVERTAYRPGARAPHEHEGEEEEEEHEPPPVRDRAFTGTSVAAGLRREIGENSAFVVNLTTAARAPALEELYNFGPHVGNLAFEIGNPDLAIERTSGIDVALRTRGSLVRAEVSAYTYAIRNFVFLSFTDEIVDGLREADVLQGDSRFVGLEASASVTTARDVQWHASVSAVRATLRDTGEALPRIPPVSGRLAVDLPWRGLSVTPEVLLSARQARVFREETPTAASAVVNLVATFFIARGHATHTLAFKAFNLTNEAYRNHTSFIKDLAPEIGRGIRATYTVRFF